MIAKNVQITEKWNKPLDQLLIGEMIERTISIRAQGTLPAFIPEMSVGKVSWAGIYPRQAQLKDTRTNDDANGLRIQTYRYLLEKAGEFEIDPVEITWYNPYLGKIYSHSTNPVKVKISPNPNLGMLATMRDSLATEPSIAIHDTDKKSTNWWELIIYTGLVLITMFYGNKLVRRIILWNKTRKLRYKNSEAYWKDQLLKTKNKSARIQILALYNWLIRRKNKAYTIEGGLGKVSCVDNVITSIYQNNQSRKLTNNDLKKIQKQTKLKDEKHSLLPKINP